jgi:hypothetical protein
MINEDGVEIEHGMVVYEPWKGGYYRKSEVDEKIKRLRRALYKACANWACAKMEYEQFDSNMFMCGFVTDKEVSWESMMKKCRAKAEEYK